MDYDKLKGREAVPYGRLEGDAERTAVPYGRLPTEGPLEPPFYYSAYGIACKHGFVGTEEEWLASLRGATGDKGDPGAGITNIEDNGDGTLTITYADGESVTTGSLEGPQGETGPQGPDGNGIASISLTSGDHSPGSTDTYTITYTDGDTDTFTVYNGDDGADGADGQNGADGADGADGVGISSIDLTSGDHSPGTTDTYTITYTDSDTDTFTVYNGADGEDGEDGQDGNGIASVTLTSGDHSPGTTDTYTITFTNGTTATFGVYNGLNGTGFSFEVVQTLPSTGAANTIYLVPNSGSAPNIYDEYIWTTAWEKLGTTEFTQVQANWNESDSTAAAYIQNKPDVDKVKQNYPDPTSYSYWRPLVIGKASSSSATGAFSEQTDEVYTFPGIRAQPSTGTVKASTFDGVSVQIPYGQVNDTSTATAYTATVPGITALRDGTMMLLKNGAVTSAAGFTININGLGAKPVYTNLAAETAESTKFNVNYTMLFIYDSTRVAGGCWICYNGYDSNTNTIAYQVRGNYGGYTVKTKCGRYRILFTSADGTKYVPANTDEVTSAAKTHTTTTEKIDPFGRIVYYGSSTVVAANGTPGVSVLWSQYNLSLGYSFNTTNAALVLSYPKPVYVKCTPQSDGSAIIDSSTPYVQALPSTADGKIYIFLGIAYSATSVELYPEHPVYEYKDGCIRLYTNAAASGASIASTTAILKGDGNGNAVAATAGTDYSLLPAVTALDNGKFLRVDNGAWAAVTVPIYNGGVS